MLPRMADQRKVKRLKSIIFLSLCFFSEKKRWSSKSVTTFTAINFIEYPLMISENTKISRIIIKFLIFLSLSKEVLYKKELQQSRFYRNRAHSNCSFVSLRSFRKVHVQHAFLINDVKIHDVIVIT